MAWTSEMAAVSDEAQKRLVVTAGTESGNPDESAAQRAISPRPSWATLTHPADDVLDLVQRDPDPLARSHHRLAQQIIGAEAGERPPIPPHGRTHATKDKRVPVISGLSFSRTTSVSACWKRTSRHDRVLGPAFPDGRQPGTNGGRIAGP